MVYGVSAQRTKHVSLWAILRCEASFKCKARKPDQQIEKQGRGFGVLSMSVRVALVCLSACRPTSLLPACLPRRLLSASVCSSVCSFVCLSVCLSVCWSVCLFVCLSACLLVWLSGCLSVCLSVSLRPSVRSSVCLPWLWVMLSLRFQQLTCSDRL